MESTETSAGDGSPSQNDNIDDDESKIDREIADLVSAEEYLESHGIEMLPYQKQMFLDIVYMDGLVVCAKGISCDQVLVNLLKAHCDPGNLILVINSADYEERHYKAELNSTHVHESSTNANEREHNYLLGGIQFVTTRILVVDLLKKRIPLELITGIIVLRAHQIIESCQEAFALRLYRQGNKTGFIKAFSNSVESFTYGYGHVEKVMRNLFLKELFIWPRFHATIQKSLKPFEPQVIELHIPMTQNMTLIQTHILDLMNYLVKEIKRLNRYVDMEEITVENCVTKRFHKILQAQLDSVWHQLNSQTKLLITDLKVLRSLMMSTIYSDSVSAYVTMKKYRTKEYAMNNSGWTLLDAAEQLFKLSKARVFNQEDEFEPEQSPKWKALSEILRVEIPNTILQSISHKPNILEQPIKVLILCQDSRTCYQLNQYLIQCSERYLFHTAIKNDIPLAKISERYKIINESDKNAIQLKDSSEFTRKSTLSQTKPTAAASTTTIKTMLENVSAEASGSSSQSEISSDKRKGFLRDRIAKRREATEEAELGKKEPEDGKIDDELETLAKEEISDSFMFRESYLLTVCPDLSLNEPTQLTKNATFESFAEMENLNLTQIANTTRKPFVCIQTFKTCEDSFMSLDRTLKEMDPGFIILYHCNVTAIRQIEVFEAQKNRHPKDRLKVFFMVHSQTVEEQSYLTNLRREKQAFELLISTKQTMVVPEYQDGKTDDTLLSLQQEKLLEVNTRKAGGQQSVPTTPKIIVDMREFRSDLPCLIHRRGIEVIPVTITIGDYILTPEICVERKSISDLIGSLNSGRLYNQCVQMTRYYARPILLIEFDQNKPFHLQGHYIISGESTSNFDITQKLQLLTMYFPKLRLVWSPSPYATAQLFEELKQGRDEPDPKQASAVGSAESGKEFENFVDQINPNVYDFLLKLPGINSRNINMILKKVKNLKELLKYKEDQLAELLDSKANAKMLWEILHVAHKPVQEIAAEKQFSSKFRRGGGRGRIY